MIFDRERERGRERKLELLNHSSPTFSKATKRIKKVVVFGETKLGYLNKTLQKPL